MVMAMIGWPERADSRNAPMERMNRPPSTRRGGQRQEHAGLLLPGHAGYTACTHCTVLTVHPRTRRDTVDMYIYVSPPLSRESQFTTPICQRGLTQ